MKVLVTYKSKTGFTREYAEFIAKELAGDAMDIKKAGAKVMKNYDVVIHGGSIFAGLIGGLKKARSNFLKSGAGHFVIFAVGATPAKVTDNVENIWNNNLLEEEKTLNNHFYLQGGLRYEEMGFMSRKLMTMMANKLQADNKCPKDDPDEVDISKSYDISSPEYALPLIEYVRTLG